MFNVMDEMLTEVFNDLVALEDQDLSNNPIYMFPPPNGIQHEFNWQDAMHYMNLNGLKEAKEYLDEAIGYPQQNIPPNDLSLSYLVDEYTYYLNETPRFNRNTCNQ